MIPGRDCFASLSERHELAMIVAEPITELIKLYLLEMLDATLSEEEIDGTR